MNRTTTVLVAGLMLCIVGGGAVVAGFASSLGGVDAGALDSWSTQLAAGAPTVVGCDNFEVADGDLDGRSVSSAAACGVLAWDTHVGEWSVGGGVVASDGTGDAAATLPLALADVTATVTVSGADSGGSIAGVIVNHDGTATYLAAALVGDVAHRVDLILVAAGVPSVVGSASATIAATTALSLTREGAEVVVRIDGVIALTHTLTAGESAALGSGTRAGLYASSSSVTFDNFRVTTPSPS